MGTWAAGSFGNDSAGDWVIDLKENPTFGFIHETLEACLEDPSAPMNNENAIAAAEVLCILDGKLPADYHEVEHNLAPAIADLQDQPRPDGLNELALRAITQNEKESELKEVWEGDEEWTSEIQSLKQRLREDHS